MVDIEILLALEGKNGCLFLKDCRQTSHSFLSFNYFFLSLLELCQVESPRKTNYEPVFSAFIQLHSLIFFPQLPRFLIPPRVEKLKRENKSYRKLGSLSGGYFKFSDFFLFPLCFFFLFFYLMLKHTLSVFLSVSLPLLPSVHLCVLGHMSAGNCSVGF